jgi:hypothetical protein
MQKIILTPEVIETINFFLKTAESYFGCANAFQTYYPHAERLKKNIFEETETNNAQEKSQERDV